MTMALVNWLSVGRRIEGSAETGRCSSWSTVLFQKFL